MLKQNLLRGSGGLAVVQPEAIDFDGTNDRLTRGADLTGNTDGKTFTFSAWVYRATGGQDNIYTNNGQRLRINFQSDNTLLITALNSSGTTILQGAATTIAPLNTFVHILISVDMTRVQASAARVAFNDLWETVSLTTYTQNQDIDFTATDHVVAGSTSAAELAGRIAHVYLDKTYRDLTVEANRRIFITADRKPVPKASLSALNPILYLPLDDPTQPGLNLGTGGNFNLTGLVARSGRGPNQYNTPYSDLDGIADNLSRTSLTGAVDGKQLTIAFTFNADSISGETIWFGQSGNYTLRAVFVSSQLRFEATAPGYTTVLLATSASATLVVGRNYHVVFSVDLADTNKRHFYINGQSVTVTWATYTNSDVDFTVGTYYVGRNGAGTHFNGRLGDVWFNTSYIDLSVPANLAKFVTGTGIDAKPADLGANGEGPTGSSPLIYLPMYGNNAGRNYGTGGDFTVNSGPYTGARGPSEFWGNRAQGNGSTGHLKRSSALTGVSDSKTFSVSFFIRILSNAVNHTVYSFQNSGGAVSNFRCVIGADTIPNITFIGQNEAGTNILNCSLTNDTIPNLADGSFHHVCFSVDLASSAVNFFVDTTNASGLYTPSLTNDFLNVGGTTANYLMAEENASVVRQWLNGLLSEFYFTTSYIDFSQEANRLLFRDAFGNPTNLPALIAAGTVPNPQIYMRFDPADRGKNSGTGGDFTVNGTITDGGQL